MGLVVLEGRESLGGKERLVSASWWGCVGWGGGWGLGGGLGRWRGGCGAALGRCFGGVASGPWACNTVLHMGRSGMATDKRVRAVYVRVSEKDWRRLRQIADALGMSVGGVVWGWCL